MSGALSVHPSNVFMSLTGSLYLLNLNSGLCCYIYRHPMKPTYDIVGKIQQIKLINL